MTQVWRVFYLAATAIALSAADGGTVEGTVINSVTGEAVAGVKVEMKTPEGRTLTYRTETGSAGEFRFSNVDPGEHSVSYEKDGFGSPETEPSADTVQVTAQGTSQLHKKLDPLTTLEGHVLDEESHGVRRITVEVLTGRGQAQRSAFTDDAGDFRISDLHPGVYLLRATPDRPAWSGTPRTFEDLTSAAAAETNMAESGRQAKASAGGSPDCLTTSAAV